MQCVRCGIPVNPREIHGGMCLSCQDDIAILFSERRAGRPEGVSGASDCSGPRSGADNRSALAAKRPIPPRVAGRNPGGQAPAASAGSLRPLVGGPND